MLIRFSVENYKSFRDQATFSMAATKGTRHGSHVHTVQGNRLLKGSFIFGANAGGKSNLVQAMAFARDIVVKGVDAIDTSGSHFRLKKGYEAKPGVFQFDFFTAGRQYSYGFALSYERRIIVSEWLAHVGGTTSTYVFNRSMDAEGTITVERDGDGLSREEKNRFAVYVGDYTVKGNIQLAQSCILTDIAKRAGQEEGFFKAFGEAFSWVENLTFIFPSSRYHGLGELATDPKLRRRFENALDFFDTGITNISSRRIPLEEMDEGFRRFIGRMPAEDSYPCVIRKDKEIMQVAKEADGQIIIHQLTMSHGCDEELFTSTDESDGTIRLFDLLPLLLFKEPKVFVIDEIGRSLHSKLLITFIERFYEETEGMSVQLIATTHDSSVLDLNLLRQDEVWFVERQPDCNSRLYPLSEFKERFDKNIEREYMLGRYGAIPRFRYEGEGMDR